VDDEGLIRRVYDPQHHPGLPNPASVVRALTLIAESPRPTPLTEQDWRRGPLDAPVVLIEYADYECRACGEAHHLLQQVLSLYGDRLCVVHRHLPLRPYHPHAQLAAEAAEAAGAQGKFWEMHARLFEAQGRLEQEHLLEYARELGLDTTRFAADLNGGRFKDKVNQDFRTAVKHKIKVPPMLFINGIPYTGRRTLEGLCTIIDALLSCTAQSAEDDGNPSTQERAACRTDQTA
jgi:protein-disulfide isomerase